MLVDTVLVYSRSFIFTLRICRDRRIRNDVLKLLEANSELKVFLSAHRWQGLDIGLWNLKSNGGLEMEKGVKESQR
jgi:hypothetical protein